MNLYIQHRKNCNRLREFLKTTEAVSLQAKKIVLEMVLEVSLQLMQSLQKFACQVSIKVLFDPVAIATPFEVFMPHSINKKWDTKVSP